ncbi:MAG: hypothetical protein COB78_11810 [Hyphomicrobiales bacterium]|nr:MAG: hypothetical protein COB78_11810 [Hyphomicrobiales bacterium]
MRDFAEKWTPVPDWEKQKIEAAGFSVHRLFGLHQTLISAATGLDPVKNKPIGWGPIAKGNDYAIQISRDRILQVSDKPTKQPFGWQMKGFATSCANDLYAVFEISGKDCNQVFARASTLNWRGESKSASMQFSKLNALVYRHGEENKLRVHIDSPYATYFWTWLEQINLN